MLTQQIQLGDITAEVVRKKIKNLHLRVYPPDGRVRISAPTRMDIDTIRGLAMSRLGWIKRQQEKLREQVGETPQEYMDGESIYIWGERYSLKVVESQRAPAVEIKNSQLILSVRPGSEAKKKEEVLEEWYRKQLKEATSPLIAKWEGLIDVKVERVYVRRMKSRWGSCNPRKHSIRLNSNLAKKPRECLEYVIVHEMAHLLEPTHNGRFKALMDRYLPNWRALRKELKRGPLGYGDWGSEDHSM
jgi:predicted metal-dependent hydrolase